MEGAGGENKLGYYLGGLDRPEHGVGKQVVVGGRKRESKSKH